MSKATFPTERLQAVIFQKHLKLDSETIDAFDDEEVLELCSEDNLEIREAHWIAVFRLYGTSMDTNLTPGDSL